MNRSLSDRNAIQVYLIGILNIHKNQEVLRTIRVLRKVPQIGRRPFPGLIFNEYDFSDIMNEPYRYQVRPIAARKNAESSQYRFMEESPVHGC